MKKFFVILLLGVICSVQPSEQPREKWTDNKGRKFVVQGVPKDLLESNTTFEVHQTQKGEHRLVVTGSRYEYFVNSKKLKGATVLDIMCQLDQRMRRLKKKLMLGLCPVCNKKKKS